MDKVQSLPTVVVPASRPCPRCGSPLDGFGPEGLCGACLFDSALAAEAPESAVQARAFTTGSFGDYEIIGEIARGGMGVVLKARQLSLNRIVALKIIRSGDLAGPIELRRFREEAQTAAGLQHPSIVAIHEVGERDGLPFFSMAYVEGPNLAQLVSENPLPARRAAGYLKIIAEAVQHAHERGVFHRDLKPSNVLIDSLDLPRVTDFGLAKRLAGDASLTLDGQIVGSPSFMSPEQATGAAEAACAASDIYSLGAMLYYLLTGRPPFVAESMPATLRLVAESEPVPPSLLVPSVPPDLETICLKCLRKEPSRRYATARDLADDLGRFLRDEPIHARPVAPVERIWRWCQRNRALASAGAAILALLLTVAVGSAIAVLRIHRDGNQLRAQLAESLLAHARAENRSNRAGRRDAALAAIRQAAAISPTLELRNEAIAALGRPDLRAGARQGMPRALEGPPSYDIDPQGRYLIFERKQHLAFERITDGAIEFELELPRGSVLLKSLSFGGSERCWLTGLLSYNAAAVWDLRTHELVWQSAPQKNLAPLAALNQKRSELFFSPDHAQLWRVDLVSRSVTSTSALPAEVSFLRSSPDGNRLLACSGSNFWVTTSPELGWQGPWRAPLTIVNGSFPADSSRLELVLEDFKLWWWDVEDNRPEGTMAIAPSGWTSLAREDGSRWMVTTSNDGTTRLWDALSSDQEVVSRVSGRKMRWHPKLQMFSLVQYGTNGLQWLEIQRPPATLALRPRFNDRRAILVPPALNQDGRVMAATAADYVNLLDTHTGQILARLEVPAAGRVTAQFEPQDRALVYSTSRGLFRWPLHWVQNDVLELGPKETLRTNGSYESLALDGAGQSLAVAQFDGEIQLRKSEWPWGTIPQKADGLCLSFSPDGRWLAGGSFNQGWLRVWDTASRQLRREFRTAMGVAPGFTPQGRLFSVTSTELAFWNLEAGAREATLPRDYIGTLRGQAVCSADGQFMAFSRSRTRVDLLYLPTLEVVASFDALDNVAEAIVLDEHGTELIIGKDRQFFDRWDLRALRAELAKLNLDWNLPPLPPADPAASKPLRVVVKD